MDDEPKIMTNRRWWDLRVLGWTKKTVPIPVFFLNNEQRRHVQHQQPRSPDRWTRFYQMWWPLRPCVPETQIFYPVSEGRVGRQGWFWYIFLKKELCYSRSPKSPQNHRVVFFFSCFFLFIFFRNNFFKLKLEQVEGMWFVGCGLVCGWFFRWSGGMGCQLACHKV